MTVGGDQEKVTFLCPATALNSSAVPTGAERERGREGGREGGRGRERESVCVYEGGREREGERESVCVYVSNVQQRSSTMLLLCLMQSVYRLSNQCIWWW